MPDALLSLVGLVATAGLWAIGFRKIPVLVGALSLMLGLHSFGVKNPDQVLLVGLIVGVPLVWAGLLGMLIYYKVKERQHRREMEERERNRQRQT